MEEESSVSIGLETHTYTMQSETDLPLPHKNSAFSTTVPTVLDPELISVCRCLLSSDTDFSEDNATSMRKRRIFSNALRTETYLRERRIPELIRFLVAKIMCSKPKNVSAYVARLLDDCMIFRSGIGQAPVLFEERHIAAVIKSFDPNDRGWLSPGQVRRAYTTLGLTPKSNLEDRTPTTEVLKLLRDTQESELLSLLLAGSEMEDEWFD